MTTPATIVKKNNWGFKAFDPVLLTKESQSKSKKVKQIPIFLTKRGIYKYNNYFQVYYREKLLKEQMNLRGWIN